MKFSKSMTNKEIAEAFREVTAVYEIEGKDLFHIRAYQNAANSIELYTAPLRDVWQEGRLTDVPGIGEKFEKYLDELFRTGTIKHFEKLLREAPAGMFPLLDIPGVGPKTALKLANELHLTNTKTARSKLQDALSGGKLTNMFSSKILSRLNAALKRRPEGSNRMLLSEAEQIASDVLEYLATCPEARAVEVLGSLRRHVSTIGDIDIAVATDTPQAVILYLKKFPKLRKIISTGEKMTTFVHSSGVQVDVKISPLSSWGDMLVHYTGGKLHNIALRSRALEKKMSVSEFGIEIDGKKQLHATEEEVYKTLGLTWVPPELREDAGEIEASGQRKLPALVELDQIQGDLHVHTNMEFPSSHDMGADSIETLLEEALRRRYAYIGFSDHNPKHSGMSAAERIEAVRRRNEHIDAEEAAFKKKHETCPFVLKGLEVDILSDGQLALEDEALALLDYAIVSVHSSFTLSKEAQTKRLLTALSHPKASILGHPTGRQLLAREGITCDWQQIFSFCADKNKLIEINGTPQRLDLPDTLIREAGKAGALLIINTDAH